MSGKSAIWTYVQSIRSTVLEDDPYLLAPANAMRPHAWSGFYHSYRDVYEGSEAALDACLALTRKPALRNVYATVSAGKSGRHYLHAQLENLARRSMIFSADESGFKRAFEFWFPKFVSWLNSDHIEMLHAVALYGVCIPEDVGRLVISEELWDQDDQTTVWLARGGLDEVIRRYRLMEHPSFNFWSSQAGPHSVLVSSRSVKTSSDAMMVFSSDDAAGYTYLTALKIVSGMPVTFGQSLWAEKSRFPASEPMLIDGESRFPPSADALCLLDRRLFRRTMKVVPVLREIDAGRRQLQASALAYAEAKYREVVKRNRSWFEDVVDAMSALESLFGLPDETSDIARRVAQRAAWLAPVDQAAQIVLSKRVKELYDVRSRVLHSGRIQQEQWLKALKALDVPAPQPDPRLRRRTHREFQTAWSDDAHPRLVDLLRWALLTVISLSQQSPSSPVGWPLRSSSRDIDSDIITGQNRSRWRAVGREWDSPLARG